MSDVQPANVFGCTQCGGELHPDEGQIFITCPYCESTVYLDKSRVVFHWYLAATLDPDKARASLARWMAGNQTVKDLDRKAQLVSTSFEYFPVWFFKRRDEAGKESISLEPAAAISVSELRKLRLPAGDLRKYDPQIDSQAHVPTVPLEAAQSWLQERHGSGGTLAETALVHIPLYTFKYTYNGEQYTAVVEGATGQTLANLYPAKAEAPYQLAGGLTAAVFLILATLPVIGALLDPGAGLGIGSLLCVGLGIPAALGLFGLAAWVAAKI